MLSDNFLCISELLFWAVPFFAVLDSMLWQGNAPFCWFSSSLPSPTSELNYIGLPHQEHKRMVKESSWCQLSLTHKTTLSRKEPWNPESKAWSWFLSQDLGEGKWSVEQWSWMRCPTPSPVPWPLCFCTSNAPLKLFTPILPCIATVAHDLKLLLGLMLFVIHCHTLPAFPIGPAQHGDI